MNIQIINGPNLNLLGTRETHIYGELSLNELQSYTEQKLNKVPNLNLFWFQSNVEGEIVDKIQEIHQTNFDGLVINPAAYSHTSVAIHDALKMLNIPIVEVHLTNTYSREDFRQTMLTAQAVSMIMSGLGQDAYAFGVQAIIEKGKNCEVSNN